MSSDVNRASDAQAFYRKIDAQNMAPLWNVMTELVTPQPRSDCLAAHWPFSRLRAAALEAGTLISTKEAERRVLVLENPGLRGRSQITTSLYAGVQLVLPAETARAHRHAAAALRFILEGEGAYTVVNGERIDMCEGDLILTPSWSWHEHGNDGDRPALWLDGLDVPLVQFLNASFAENRDEAQPPGQQAEVARHASRAGTLLPEADGNAGASRAVYCYPYARSRDALERLMRSEQWDPCHGLKLRFSDPRTGGHALPTIGSWIQLLPPGFTSATYRATDATVFSVAEGRGRTFIGDEVIDWAKRDVFVAPSWTAIRHSCAETAVLFSFSDRPVQQAAGLFKEERGSP